ncbi:hypothetical protein MCOR27_003949 [Pyricularia oryzae]|uniref:Importin N-terminal domain-containing protein n=3 Tax=Pyricularia TaxID=48558 RepID=A0ABQ8NEF3_PYRGI|nr:transportin-2 [Pyricularia oryzae 70-15]KAH8842040.1 hypothetical protein MCOR01_005981 [Pyricularia oryzae]KAI6295699.1 hypothetical protein MCOR33_007493 [Pyricularia grisea]EHA57216.1 transportin-2 [Pyricularia oryzae 70-15]KAH9435223.1 hypothetical protein MCOR02_004174 [Pyricularia oryzae]KAI6258752.1 hypothetical protein MCOR19_004852 [Pyricularia oryzae]
MAWQPSTESLQTLAVCLKDSLSAFNKDSQKQAEQMLSQAKASPDFNNYLALIFSSSESLPGVQIGQQDLHVIRAAAAIMLKNSIKNDFKQIPESSLEMIKQAIPIGIQDKNSQIRSYAGNIATELIRRGGIFSWPSFLPELLAMFSNESGQVTPEAQEGAISAMAKICEDNTKTLEREHNGQRPLNYLLPKLIEATKNPQPKVRVHALTAINVFTSRKSQAMLNNIDSLLQHLFYLSQDDNVDVRKEVCRAFVRLVETRPDKLQPHIADLVDYIIVQQKSEDEELSVEAAEFWLSVGEHDDLWQLLIPHIQKIMPVLLDCMRYSGEDIAALEGASDDEDEDDRAEDIKPQFATKKLTRAANGEVLDGSKDGNPGFQRLDDMNDDLEEGELEDDEEGDENPDEKWSVRKCSAAALDVFARDFNAPVFESILPYLSQNLKHDEWPHREAAVLALGAIADGCMNVVTPHLPELVPYLISLLNDTEPVVRQITCWTLARYSSWAAALTEPNDKQQYFVPMMEGILTKMLDKNKKVQEAAASAMANLEEKAGKVLEPYSGPIIQQFVRCFAKYKDKNIYILYDCVQTLAESIGPVLATPELSNTLMPVLIDRWQKVPDQSRELFPLLECMSYVAMALGDSFAPYAQPIFRRCLEIIHQNLEQSHHAKNNGAIDQPDRDFLVTSLDMLSAIVQCLEPAKSSELVGQSNQQLFELLGLCMDDLADEVKQSAYALLGDCARYVFGQLQPNLATLLPILLKQLDLDNLLDEEMDDDFGVVNNACWSAGEIAIQHGKGMAPFVQELLQRCVEILSNPRVPKSVRENAAIALGRLGIDNAELLAPHLNMFTDDFLNAMDEVDPSEEKATAFKGFALTVSRNPQAIEKDIPHFFLAIAKYRDLVNLRSPIKQELHDAFRNVINVYQQIIPQFDSFLSTMPQDAQASLKQLYGI